MTTSRVIIVGDKVAERFGQHLKFVAEKDARRIFMRALNRGGDQARTQVRRSLVRQTGIVYGKIRQAVTEDRATPNNLAYSLIAVGEETNLSLFGARQGKRGVSAAPWRMRRVFKGTFIVPTYGGRVFKRTTNERGPLEALFGPNIAREMMRSPTINEWDQVGPFVLNRVEHELMRLFNR
ncbi:hypothetical protein [Chelatococcus sp. XZ-Ab1]|uniref:hypothetical protein n=1 Tax=Chelatococcus sp. XZ-Ab1 TaxID=3034027 RepID=UPI0023E40686|nr:hypothetical protein [Chelatococcus sp. XZ-Ab1]